MSNVDKRNCLKCGVWFDAAEFHLCQPKVILPPNLPLPPNPALRAGYRFGEDDEDPSPQPQTERMTEESPCYCLQPECERETHVRPRDARDTRLAALTREVSSLKETLRIERAEHEADTRAMFEKLEPASVEISALKAERDDARLDAEIYARFLRRLVKVMRGTTTIRVWSADGVEEALRDTENFLGGDLSDEEANLKAEREAYLAALSARAEKAEALNRSALVHATGGCDCPEGTTWRQRLALDGED